MGLPVLDEETPLYAAPPIVNLIVLRSPDIHKAVRFYQAMGMVFSLEQHGNGPKHYSSSSNGFVFELYPLTANRSPTSSTRLGFIVDSVDEIVPLLHVAGAELVTPPHDSEWGRQAVVRDIDGHTVELVTPPGRDSRTEAT